MLIKVDKFIEALYLNGVMKDEGRYGYVEMERTNKIGNYPKIYE